MGESDAGEPPVPARNEASLYSQAFDALPLGIVFQDAQGAITQANTAAQDILGLSFDQMRGLTSVDPRWGTVHEDGSPFPGDTHPAMVALRTGQAVLGVRMGVHNPQRADTTWINVKAFPSFDAGTGAIQGVYALFEDITQNLRSEREQARLGRARLLAGGCNLALLESRDHQALLDGFCRFLIEPGGYTLAWIALIEESAAVPARLAGHAGAPLDEQYAAREIDLGAAGRALRTGSAQIARNPPHGAAPPGSVASVAVPLVSADQSLGVLCVHSGERDSFNTEEVALIEEMARSLAFGIEVHRARRRRVAAEAELAKYREHLEGLVEQRTAELSVAKQAAEAASDAKTAFLANISHELRMPLHGVIGMTALAQARATDQTQREHLDGVMNAARHLGVVVNDLLDISRIETRRLSLVEDCFLLHDVIDTPANISRLSAAEKGLRFAVDADPALAGMPFRGDASRLRQVLLNLTSNAVKFTATGRVEVRVSLAEDGITDALLRFEVSDSGIGIAAADQARLFEMFEQARSPAGGLQYGAGLGLALSRRLAVAMGGTMGLQSREGIGSTFWFTARVRKERARVPEHGAPKAAGTALETLKREHGGKRLLLVDDNDDNRVLLRAQLKPVWPSVDIAADGVEALELAAERRYDLVLMDVRMPRMDGLEATRRIRQLPGWADTPIIAMTANVYPEDRARCMAAGMNDFIPKAVRAEAPFEMLLKWLAPR
jgi:PAS domain S-box-containing protein